MGGSVTRTCEECTYVDVDVRDEPCFKCLSGYSGNGCFVRKEENRERTERHKATPRQQVIVRDENCPLPWSS